MVRSLLLLLIFNSQLLSANPLMKQKCDELGSKLTGNTISCLHLDTSTEISSEATNLSKVSQPLQEWLWISDKVSKTISDNNKKKKFLENTARSFRVAKSGYPRKEKDVNHLKTVENYYAQYEKLIEVTRDETLAHDALQECRRPSITGWQLCTQLKRDELKYLYAAAQAKKLSILMSFPLLANESVRESVEDEMDIYEKFDKGEYKSDLDVNRKMKKINNREDFLKLRKAKRRKNFIHHAMPLGISKSMQALYKRQKKWKDFQAESNLEAKNEVKLQLGKRQKGFWEKNFSQDYKEAVEERQTDNTEFITELLDGADLKKEMNNPYIGKAVCDIYQRNEKQIVKDKEFRENLDNALMAVSFAPFVGGPLRGISMFAKLSKWGTRGRKALLAMSAEAAILGPELALLAGDAQKCSGLKVRLLATDEEAREILDPEHPSFAEKSVNYDKINTCQKELENQALFVMGVGSLGVLAPTYSFIKGGKIIKNFGKGKDANKVLKQMADQQNKKALDDFLKSEGLSKLDAKFIYDDFAKFKKQNPKLEGDTLIAKYKEKFNKDFPMPVCKI